MPALTENGAGSSATSAGATTSTVSSGTASEALIKAASAASSPATEPAAGAGTPTSAAGSEPAGSTQPAISAAAASGTPGAVQPGTPSQSIPLDRHEAALRNARAEFAWVSQVPDHHRAVIQRFAANPEQFVVDLIAEIDQARAGAKKTEPLVDPEPDLVSDDGKYKTYSSDRVAQLLKNQETRLLERFHTEVRPVMELHSTLQEERQNTAVAGLAADTLKHFRSLPHFTKENEPEIRQRMEAIVAANPSVLKTDGAKAVMYTAYNAFLAEKVFPTITDQAKQTVIAEFQRKAQAEHGSVMPVDSSAGGKTPVLRNKTDLARHMESLASASA